MAAGSRSSFSPHLLLEGTTRRRFEFNASPSPVLLSTRLPRMAMFIVFRKANGEPVWKIKLFNYEHPAGQKVLENFLGM